MVIPSKSFGWWPADEVRSDRGSFLVSRVSFLVFRWICGREEFRNDTQFRKFGSDGAPPSKVISEFGMNQIAKRDTRNERRET